MDWFDSLRLMDDPIAIGGCIEEGEQQQGFDVVSSQSILEKVGFDIDVFVSFDVCLCADVNYNPDTVQALLATVLLTKAETVILISRELCSIDSLID